MAMLTTRAQAILMLTLLMVAATVVHGRAFASADAAAALVQLLDGAGLNAIAAEDPAEPGTFAAALYIPGSQLLVVSARHPSVDGIRHRLATKQFREVYLDLQASPTPDGKFFVHDSGADGILSARPGSGEVDILYEDGTRQTLFNGDVRGQQLTDAQYDARLAAADEHYARVLKLLASAIQRQSSYGPLRRGHSSRYSRMNLQEFRSGAAARVADAEQVLAEDLRDTASPLAVISSLGALSLEASLAYTACDDAELASNRE
jgi:hypothetical protein